MKIEPDRYYPAKEPDLDVIGAEQTRARWRHEGKGPPFIKCGSRVVYYGKDVLDWLDANRVETASDVNR